MHGVIIPSASNSDTKIRSKVKHISQTRSFFHIRSHYSDEIEKMYKSKNIS